jgi:circadian clock protein KaiB
MDSFSGNDARGHVPRQKTYLYLYVADQSPNSTRAVANLEAICEAYLEECSYQVTVVDILRNPLRALDEGILITPTLIRLGAPSRRVIGDLSDHDQVVQSLGLEQQNP